MPPLLLDTADAATFGRWFRRHQPDVVLGLDLPVLLEWLRGLGQEVPRAVGVVSLDRRPQDRGIAGIGQDYGKIGANAVDLVIGMTRRNELGPPAIAMTLLSEGRWHPGSTLSTKS